MTTPLTLNRRETYTASMVIFIGLFYLWPLAASLLHTGRIDLPVPVTAMLFTILLPGVLYITGGILFFRQRRAGWVISSALLLQLIPVVYRYIYNVITAGSLYSYIAITLAFFVLLLLSIIFLFSRDTRAKFSVNNTSYLLVILLYAALTLIRYLF